MSLARGGRILWVIGLLYLLCGLVLFLGQRSLMYFPSHVDTEAKGALPFRPWQASGGEFLGYVREALGPPRRLIILFHGNGGEALGRRWLDELVPSNEVTLLLAEYPGYGAKAGSPSEAALMQAGRDVLNEAKNRWQKVPMTLIGESLGSGVASALAAEPSVDRLALISPFYSALDVAKRKIPFWPMSFLMKDTYRSDLFLKKANVTLAVIHGTLDDVVPFSSGKMIFATYRGGPKQLTAVEGAGHNNLVDVILKSPEASHFRLFVQAL